MEKDQYFDINVEMLPEGMLVFAFNLYVTDAKRLRYIPFLMGNQPMTSERRQQLARFLQAGLILAVKRSQMKTFLQQVELEEEEVPSLNPENSDIQVQKISPYAPPEQGVKTQHQNNSKTLRDEVHALVSVRDTHINQLKQKYGIARPNENELDVEAEILLADIGENDVESENPEFEAWKQRKKEKDQLRKAIEKDFSLRSAMGNAFLEGNFSPLIEQMRKEVSIFEYTVSPTTSLAIWMVDKLLTEDNRLNRIVTLTYFLAKINRQRSEEILGDLIVASFLHKIGMTQMDSFFSFKPLFKTNEKERKMLRKYPGLAAHLIRKSKLEISNSCKTIIAEHQERFNGSGYPFNKKSDYIHPCALILGLASHIIEYSEGLVVEQSMPLKEVISRIVNQTPTEGLDINFGYELCQSLGPFLAVDTSAQQTSSEDESSKETLQAA